MHYEQAGRVSFSFLGVPYRLSGTGFRFRFLDVVSCTSTSYRLGCFIHGITDVLTDFSCFLSVSDMNTSDTAIILEQATNFLGCFAKLRKAIFSRVISVRPSARPPVWADGRTDARPTGQTSDFRIMTVRANVASRGSGFHVRRKTNVLEYSS
jgi:hypothetical protein